MEADILFMPYNYLFLLDARSTDDQPIIDIENSIIIVDEAHNIRAFAEDQGSFEISDQQLETCLEELKWIEEEGKEGGREIDIVRDLTTHW